MSPSVTISITTILFTAGAAAIIAIALYMLVLWLVAPKPVAQPIESVVEIHVDDRGRPFVATGSKVTYRVKGGVYDATPSPDLTEIAMMLAKPYYTHSDFRKARIDFKARVMTIETFDYELKNRLITSSDPGVAFAAAFNPAPTKQAFVRF